MNILVTLDQNYLSHAQVMLFSLFLNNPGESIDVYLICDDMDEHALEPLAALCEGAHARLHPIHVREDWFADAPTVRYYSRAMYYRLLAWQVLPQELDRILYLDPDILVIGPLCGLYGMDMGDHPFAAAVHKGIIDLSGPVNKLRLASYESDGYFNSGVLMMNLPAISRVVKPEDIFRYVHDNKAVLVLPDQDILNGLYGERILPIDETRYNYDVRRFREYLIASQGERDMDWVMRNTSILHFCGKRKPWNARIGRFLTLYRHYAALQERYAAR